VFLSLFLCVYVVVLCLFCVCLYQLWFVDRSNLTLTADSIVVFGDLQVGNSSRPFTNNASIVLTGTRSSPTVVVDNAYPLGNKLIAVFGNLSLVGVPRSVTWTRLAAPAPAGSNTLLLAQPVDWQVGEEVVVSPTTFASSELETAVITAVSSDRTALTLSRALTYAHAGQYLPVTGWSLNGGIVPLAAAVGLLTRNVKLIGADVNASTVNYGASVVVGNLARVSGVRTGALFVSNTQVCATDLRSQLAVLLLCSACSALLN
jgi:hypothetical protein